MHFPTMRGTETSETKSKHKSFFFGVALSNDVSQEPKNSRDSQGYKEQNLESNALNI